MLHVLHFTHGVMIRGGDGWHGRPQAKRSGNDQYEFFHDIPLVA
jgi:hypothetical protein